MVWIHACSQACSAQHLRIRSSKTRWRMFGNVFLCILLGMAESFAPCQNLKASLNMHDQPLTFLRLPLIHDGGSVMTAGFPAHAPCPPQSWYYPLSSSPCWGRQSVT
ncbi:hypothetical protein ARMSODRAFT_683986 [Armillaria solidipes]|uniref:Uncharacterized protein n=1 Tax=Armillaria solidipes TaxID=1076256 RepID=A0A2H3AVL6_9AGAR|nr:hypothetical protein ARMSODRAFT_683986 [Armillaria solidipes]